MFLPFRPILAGIPTYKSDKFLVLILNYLMINESAIKDSFSFAKETIK